jgi:hypothetical protein
MKRTLEGSLENLGGFFGEPWKVLLRTLEGSLKNIGGSKNRHQNIIRRKAEN